MNSLEFSTITSVTNIDSSASNEAPNHKVVQVINWNGFNLKFIELKHRESYIVVEGLVPEEVEALLDKQNDIKCMTFLENSNRKVYNINSKEGLLSFFTTMSSYYREHNISCEKSVDDYDSLLAEANAILLEISKPGVSTSDCVQTNPSLLKIYNKSNEILATTDLGQELRECLNNFDETICCIIYVNKF